MYSLYYIYYRGITTSYLVLFDCTHEEWPRKWLKVRDEGRFHTHPDPVSDPGP